MGGRRRKSDNAGPRSGNKSTSRKPSSPNHLAKLRSANIILALAIFLVGALAGSFIQLDRGIPIADDTSLSTSTAAQDRFLTLYELLALSDEQLEQMDPIEVDLIVAKTIPECESLDIGYYKKIVDDWAEHVRSEIDRHLYKFDEHPEEYNNSLITFKAGMMRTVIGLDFEIGYDLESVAFDEGIVTHLGVSFDDAVCEGISRRALGVPRIALSHASRVRDVAQAKGLETASSAELDLAMKIEGIDSLGLRREHRCILRTLVNADPRPVSARSLALALGVEVATVTSVLEPPLVRLGLVIIGTGGRRITHAGRNHLHEEHIDESVDVD